MNILIDTHVLLWYMVGDRRLGTDTRKTLDSSRNNIYLSSASLWEITIKESIGKLRLSCSIPDLEQYLSKQGIIVLNFDFDDLETLRSLPFHHQDPFDRMIVAQAIAKDLRIISDDSKVLRYFEA